MMSSIYINFIDGKLSEKGIIELILTDFGGGLYAYMLMLQNAGRVSEAKLIENLRTIIFDNRSKYDKGEVDKSYLADELIKVYFLLTTQLTVIKTIPEKEWEAELFTSYLNELLSFKFQLTNTVAKEEKAT